MITEESLINIEGVSYVKLDQAYLEPTSAKPYIATLVTLFTSVSLVITDFIGCGGNTAITRDKLAFAL